MQRRVACYYTSISRARESIEEAGFVYKVGYKP
jgi:hypothetical protein